MLDSGAPSAAPELRIERHAQERWSQASRLIFRFAFVYLILYCLPTEGGRVDLFLPVIPFDTGRLGEWLATPWRALGSWTAIHVFHLSGPVTRFHPTGSGDTTLDYMQVFNFFVISALSALVWSILDRRRPNYNSLYPWLRLVVRFTLAFTMLSYGFAKVFPLQFGPAPSFLKLTENIGEASPMGLLWTMMAASTPYTFFCGLAEVTAGTLLLFRRTLTVGALAGAAVMLNIVLLNFCYDVPVKLYSTHLLMMALFLVIADAKSLWSFFISHSTARLRGVWVPPWEGRSLRIARVALQALVIVSVLYSAIKGNWDFMRQQNNSYSAKSPFEGMWSRNESDAKSTWHTVVFEPGRATVRLPDRSTLYLKATYEQDKHCFKLQNTFIGTDGEVCVQQPDSTHLTIDGTLDKKPVAAVLRRVEPKTFLLTTRGFHWISEDPFNR